MIPEVLETSEVQTQKEKEQFTMKIRKLEMWITAAFITVALLISPLASATEKTEKADLKPKVTVQVDGLACPF